MARRNNPKKRKLKPRILIMCEGETERNYFQAIKESAEYKKALTAINPQVLKAKHSSPEHEQVVDEALRRGKEAKREGNPYNKIWVVISNVFKVHPNYVDEWRDFENRYYYQKAVEWLEGRV